MQIDFHHTVTYCVARIAGFDRERAGIIAHASQYVDDAIEEGTVKFDNGMVFEQISSAHKTLDYRNLEQLANKQVWIPFHFLPGNDSLPAGSYQGDDPVDRTICRPNSYVARDMLRECIRAQQSPFGLHRLGISMHVYADTWAHQGFTGINHHINRASKLLDANGEIDPRKQERIRQFYTEKSVGQQIIDRVTGLFVSGMLPLGHGAVLSYPDKPFLTWGYTNGWGEVIHRDNPTDFLTAAQQMCEWLQRYLLGTIDAAVPGLPPRDRDLIAETIANTTDWEGKVRHDRWLDLIRAGKFSFGADDAIDYIATGKGSWLHDAFGDVSPHDRDPRDLHPYDPRFLHSNWKLFHDALLAHRSFVIHELLPHYQIQIV
jgi:hypothetical protein